MLWRVRYLTVVHMRRVIGNFGTGIRHCTKFVAALIILAAPLIPRLVLLGCKSHKTSEVIKVADSAF
jgi:hypothetical protein